MHTPRPLLPALLGLVSLLGVAGCGDAGVLARPVVDGEAASAPPIAAATPASDDDPARWVLTAATDDTAGSPDAADGAAVPASEAVASSDEDDTATRTSTSPVAPHARSEVSLTGLAPLRFGMTTDEAAAALGIRWAVEDGADEFHRDYGCQWLTAADGELAGLSFMFPGWPASRLERIEVRDGRWRTAVDVRVGDPVDPALARHPDATVEPDLHDPRARVVYLPVDGGGVRYVLWAGPDGVVEAVRYGLEGATAAPEGCL